MEILIPILLILVGLALVVVEVTVVPGLNVVGVIGVLGAAVGVVVAFAEFGPAGGLGTLAATILAAGGIAYVLWESGAWDRFVLFDSLRRDAGADAEETESRARLLGKTGTALTPLRPGGVADVEGARVEVETEGAFVAAGSRVRVVALDRRRILVRLDEVA
ncbi:NfeD family protein [Rubrivirga marina]|uniref:NfeD family protein n=1 Tax=Rubrivirga marina TaxID=1196024 RepID=UPI001C52F7B5|nr:NfeD family protein [Rubrivirga marina]